MLDALRNWLRGWRQRDTAPLAAVPDAGDALALPPEPAPGEQVEARLALPYEEQLFDRARVQWQFGDWASLARLERDAVHSHPERARLALLVAAAHMQLRQVEAGRAFLRLAQEYGCSKKLIAQVLISGVHNTLGRAAIVNDQQERALQHFESAIALGAPGSEQRLLSQARAQEQFKQVRTPSPAAAAAAVALRPADAAAPDFQPLPCPLLPPGFGASAGVPAELAAALATLAGVCATLCADAAMPAIQSCTVAHRDRRYYFAHFAGDYIPATMQRTGKFYEAPFLNLLARLHQPGKLIVDGGANLGNHSVFFAAVLKAQVVAFEPQPHNHLLLCANRSLNELDQSIDVRRKALGAAPGTVTLHLAQANNYGTFSSAVPAAGEAGQPGSASPGFEVTVSTLDDELASEADAISIIKLDIEGMELAALQGARQILRRGKPLIAVECFNKSLYATVKAFLAQFDYYLIESTNATPTFIFLNTHNAFHQQALAAHLERVSIDKLRSNSQFNQR